MNFFFCEKCNKRITDAELESGVALDKKAKGVYCKQCSVGVKTTEFAAITDDQIKSHVVQPPTAELKRASANSIAAVPRGPSSGERHAPSSAERHSSIKVTAAPRNKPNTPDSKSASIGMIVGAIGGVTILIFLLAGPGKPKEHKTELTTAPLPAPPPPLSPPVTPTPKTNLEASNSSHTQPAPPKTTQPVVETKPPVTPPENFVTSAPVIAVPSPPATPVETAPKATLPPVVETPAKEKTPPVEPEKAPPLIAVDMKSPAIVYAEFHDDLLTALRGGDVQLATQRVTQAEQNALLKPLEKEIVQDRAILKWYSELDKALLRGIDKLREIDNFELRPQVGAPIQVGKRATFQLSTVNDGKIEVGAQGVSMTISIDKLQPVTRNKLQAMGFADDGSGVLRRAFIQVLAAGSDPSAILTVPAMLEKARKAGAAEDEAATLERLLKSAEAPARELAAIMTWDEINKAVQDKQYPRLALLPSITAFKTTFSNTTFGAKKRDEAKSLYSAILGEIGLLLYLKFDDSSAMTLDTAGRNECKVVGAPACVGGKFGSALKFDGAHDYVTLPDGFFVDKKTVSVSLWFNTKSAPVAILGYQSSEPLSGTHSNYVPILYIGSDGKLHGEFWSGGASPISGDKPVNDGAWHHIALTVKETGQSLYLDGVCIGSLSGDHKPLDMKKNQIGLAFTDGWIGAGKGWMYYEGMLDDFRVHDHALSEEEIQTINSFSPKSP